ncbi:kinase [Sphingomonas soli]|uniref:kinase n=1 Tax=Sphingomonas soli TaxID=266127 RepID=UPI000B1B20C3|nr:kinase [Sphingomonas soli]
MADPTVRIAESIAARPPHPGRKRPFVLGIAGAQGSGKSTVARALAERFGCPILSLDDLYLDGTSRSALAARVHPLLSTRGVPGTHDPAAGLAAIESLGRPGVTHLPRFDKARDEPGAPEACQGPADILILEGWCLGVQPQPESELAAPVNPLEAEQDRDGVWRRWVNAQIAPYQPLFARIDMLVFLAAPGFDVVLRWRTEQEHALRRALSPDAGMSDVQVAEFVQHYQRLTEHMLRHARDWADLVIPLDEARRAISAA